MNNNKLIPVWLNLALTVLTALVAALELHVIFNAETAVICPVLYFLCAILALAYCIAGFKKSSAQIYFVFCILFAICKGVSVIALEGITVPREVLCIAAFGCICILTAVSNLGKIKSYILAGAEAACEVAMFVLLCTEGPEHTQMLESLGQVLVSAVFCIMVYGKYKDKAARGAK